MSDEPADDPVLRSARTILVGAATVIVILAVVLIFGFM